MLFGKKNLIKVIYQIKKEPYGFEKKNKKVTEEELEALQNDPKIRILEIKK